MPKAIFRPCRRFVAAHFFPWLARDLRVPVTRISEIVNQRRSVTSDTALRPARYFGTTPEFWMNLQTSYDLDTARSGVAAIERDVRPIQAT
ncbi:MAG: HigA family addiction module antitoxin [Bryobacteraceae bacterium]